METDEYSTQYVQNFKMSFCQKWDNFSVEWLQLPWLGMRLTLAAPPSDTIQFSYPQITISCSKMGITHMHTHTSTEREHTMGWGTHKAYLSHYRLFHQALGRLHGRTTGSYNWPHNSIFNSAAMSFTAKMLRSPSTNGWCNSQTSWSESPSSHPWIHHIHPPPPFQPHLWCDVTRCNALGS